MWRGAIRSLSSAPRAATCPKQAAYLQEACIAVDESDHVLGAVTKESAHRVDSLCLHRAFSVFAFTPNRRLILQRRSLEKITFPGVWTNTCCSHPLFDKDEMGEDEEARDGVVRAARRKLFHEIGLHPEVSHRLPTHVVGRYLYKAVMDNGEWGEHELDYVLIIEDLNMETLRRNPEEVLEICALDEKEIDGRLSTDAFSPWFRLFWKRGLLSSWWKKLGHDTITFDNTIQRL